MKKSDFLSIETLIYLYPFCFINLNISLFFDAAIINKLRLEHFIIYFLGIYMFFQFFKNLWRPSFKTALISIFIVFHVVMGIFLTDFSSPYFKILKFIGYLESYFSFIIILLFVDFYYSTYPLKAKATLRNFIKCVIISSFFVLGIIILFYFNPINLDLIKLFSSDPGMVKRAFNVGRYIGPISQPIESGFYAGIGILICLIAWNYNYLNKMLITFGFVIFNLIGFLSGSKVYLVATIIFMILALLFYLRSKIFFYASLFIGYILFHLLMVVISSFFLLDTLTKNYSIYNVKYYDLQNYIKSDPLKIISGGRIRMKQADVTSDTNTDTNTDTVSPPKYFEYQGPLDSQHKFIAAHGGKKSVFLLFLFYIYIIYSIFKIYFFSDVKGICLFATTSLILITSLGFPIFFANKIFVFSCITIQFIFVWTSNIRNYKLP